MSTEKKHISTGEKFIRVLCGWIPFVDSIGGYLRGLSYGKELRYEGAVSPFTNKKNIGEDVKAEINFKEFNSYAIWTKRIFEMAAVALVVAVLIGALASPIPGLTPLIGLGLLGGFKVIGIGLGLTLAARTTGALLGHAIDCFRITKHPFVKKNQGDSMKPYIVDFRSLKSWGKTLLFGIFGELGYTTVSSWFPKGEKKPAVKSYIPPPITGGKSSDLGPNAHPHPMFDHLVQETHSPRLDPTRTSINTDDPPTRVVSSSLSKVSTTLSEGEGSSSSDRDNSSSIPGNHHR